MSGSSPNKLNRHRQNIPPDTKEHTFPKQPVERTPELTTWKNTKPVLTDRKWRRPPAF